nr:hypothetical protein [Sporomusa silvacetica]
MPSPLGRPNCYAIHGAIGTSAIRARRQQKPPVPFRGIVVQSRESYTFYLDKKIIAKIVLEIKNEAM